VDERRRGAVPKAAPARKQAIARPAERRGVPTSGRVVTLFIGQGHGYIRLSNARDVFFHRSDVREGTSFNDFAIGDAVTFELIEDKVSGARALSVALSKPRR
jgi:cold shock CspA family protein